MALDYLLEQKKCVKKLETSFAAGIFKPTVVAIQEDYASDNKICLTSVVFIPPEISHKINLLVTEKLRKIDPGQYFFTAESMHLTIKNVRTIHNPPLFSENDLLKVDKLFKDTVKMFPTYNFIIEDVLIFPTSISVMGYATVAHQQLVLALDKGLNEIGVPDNKKYISDSVFWGNITVCRFTREPKEDLLREARRMRNLKIGKVKVEKISLITCNAACHPNTLKVINEYELKK